MTTPEFSEPVSETAIRVQHGIKRELLPLVKLKGVGRVRARRLFNNNIMIPDDLEKAGFDRVAAIVGRNIARQIMEEAAGRKRAGAKTRAESGSATYEEEEVSGNGRDDPAQSDLFSF